jgi:hypothetical protein
MANINVELKGFVTDCPYRYDGQAGAAAITLHDSSRTAQEAFIHDLYTRLRHQGLTLYQIPRLVRFVEA